MESIVLQGHRHCAYCLLPISGEQVKLCEKCGRRAYCSDLCRTKDWSDPESHESRGQGHVNWCHLLCGEEDLDWKVAPVEGKGLGLIALRSIPARSRILVEACQTSPHAHPALKNLMPLGDDKTLQEKWDLNSLGCDGESSVVCLRLSRTNHSCNDNAAHVFCSTFKVKILFAERDIAPGEEICINYQPFTTPSATKSPSSVVLGCALNLESKWGITCPSDCVCKDAKILEDVRKSVQLSSTIRTLAKEGNVQDALKMVEELMTLYANSAMPTSWLDKGRRTLWDGFRFGIMTQATLPKGMECLNQLLEIMGDILHPMSKDMQEYQGFQNNPESHPNYLSYEKEQ